MSRKGCAAAPGFPRRCINCRGCCAALSRHKAAPTGIAQVLGYRAWRWFDQPGDRSRRIWLTRVKRSSGCTVSDTAIRSPFSSR
ncbi:MAG: hypothetical protein E6Q70_11525 [Pseudomonas monteilii]|nr:MAG: hypothetical protein E6Q70_11525 [Pseudomonas monteilii]